MIKVLQLVIKDSGLHNLKQFSACQSLNDTENFEEYRLVISRLCLSLGLSDASSWLDFDRMSQLEC